MSAGTTQRAFTAQLKKVYTWYTGGFVLFVVALAILEKAGMPRAWIGYVFLLATVGIVVAFFVFLVLFVVFGLAMRRARKNVQYGEDGSRFIIYTNIPGAGTGNADRVRRDDPDTYELSPDEYTVEAAPSKKPGDTDPKALGDHGKS